MQVFMHFSCRKLLVARNWKWGDSLIDPSGERGAEDIKCVGWVKI